MALQALQSSRLPSDPARTTAWVGGAAVVGYAALVAHAAGSWDWNVWGGLLMGPALVAVSLPVLLRLGRQAGELSSGLLVAALLLKLLGGVARWLQSWVLAGGADAERYHDAGTAISRALHDRLPWSVAGPVPGTGFMEGLTGYVYWAFGTSRLGGFLFFSWLSFWGLLLFTRAFRTALPDGDARRYSLLVLFLPSLLFWPSSPGKEAWMVLCLGTACLGAARLFARVRGGLLLLAVGVLGCLAVRPHMAVLVVASLAVGYLVRPARPGAVLSGPAKLVGLVLLGLVLLVVLAKANAFFGTAGGASGALDEASRRTSQGGSEYDAAPVRSPLDLPVAVVSVLFRPFPFEATNVPAFAAGVEGLVLLGLLVLARDRLRGLLGRLRRQPYLAFALTYTLLFIIAFSSFANFGVLTRQRVQVFPLFLVLLALPETRRPAPARAPVPTGSRRPA